MLMDDLKQLGEEYKCQLSQKTQKSYVPIINAFILHINDVFSDKNETVDAIFTHLITRRVIEDAGLTYIESDKVTSVAGVSKYLTVVGDFYFNLIHERYPQNILRNYNFQESYKNILMRTGKTLEEKKSFDHISKEDYKKLKDFFRNSDNLSTKQRAANVAMQLMLLYGFKIGIINDLKKDDFDEEQGVLIVNRKYLLELPFTLAREIASMKRSNDYSVYLFSGKNGQKTNNNHFDYDIKRLKDEQDLQIDNLTTSSLTKYAIINLFEQGLNPTTISEITGAKSDVLEYCQMEAANNLQTISNRFINSKIRNIETFEDFIY